MLDYRTILTLRYSVGLSGTEISRQIDNASKTGVTDFLRAFEKSEKISFPLPQGISNYEMSKKHYISFIAAVKDDGYEIKKLYAEGNAEARFKINRTKYFLYYCNMHGLYGKYGYLRVHSLFYHTGQSVNAAFEKWHRVRRERVRKRNRKRVILPEGSFSEFFPFRFVFNDFQ